MMAVSEEHKVPYTFLTIHILVNCWPQAHKVQKSSVSRP